MSVFNRTLTVYDLQVQLRLECVLTMLLEIVVLVCERRLQPLVENSIDCVSYNGVSCKKHISKAPFEIALPSNYY